MPHEKDLDVNILSYTDYGPGPYHLPPSSPGMLLKPPFLDIISKNEILGSVPSIYTEVLDQLFFSYFFFSLLEVFALLELCPKIANVGRLWTMGFRVVNMGTQIIYTGGWRIILLL